MGTVSVRYPAGVTTGLTPETMEEIRNAIWARADNGELPPALTGSAASDTITWVFHRQAPEGPHGSTMLIFAYARFTHRVLWSVTGDAAWDFIHPPMVPPRGDELAAPVEINLSSPVWVQLTPDGAEFLLNSLQRTMPHRAAGVEVNSIARHRWPGFNTGEWVRFQLFELMEHFGPSVPAHSMYHPFVKNMVRLTPPE